VFDTEHLPGAFDRERFQPIDDLLALVVAPARIALRVLVREHAAHRLEHRARDVVLRGNQADRRRLPLDFVGNQSRNFGIGLGETEWLTVNAMKSAFAPFDERLRIINEVVKPGYARLRAREARVVAAGSATSTPRPRRTG